MGHPRRAQAAPSPVQLLAIFQAKEQGLPLPEISRRTKYAVSSIMRWWHQWGEDTAFFEAVGCELPDLVRAHSFDVLFPDLETKLISDESLETPTVMPKELLPPKTQPVSLKGDASFSAPLEAIKERPVHFTHSRLTGDDWNQ